MVSLLDSPPIVRAVVLLVAVVMLLTGCSSGRSVDRSPEGLLLCGGQFAGKDRRLVWELPSLDGIGNDTASLTPPPQNQSQKGWTGGGKSFEASCEDLKVTGRAAVVVQGHPTDPPTRQLARSVFWLRVSVGDRSGWTAPGAIMPNSGPYYDPARKLPVVPVSSIDTNGEPDLTFGKQAGRNLSGEACVQGEATASGSGLLLRNLGTAATPTEIDIEAGARGGGSKGTTNPGGGSLVRVKLLRGIEPGETADLSRLPGGVTTIDPEHKIKELDESNNTVAWSGAGVTAYQCG